jgi:transposase
MQLNRNMLPDLIRMILNFPEMSDRQIALMGVASHETVRSYRRKVMSVDRSKLFGPDGDLHDGYRLDEVLNGRQRRARKRAGPDWAEVTAALKQGKLGKDIWQAFRTKKPDGISMSQFYAELKTHLEAPKTEMLNDWQPGDCLQVDFAGDTVTCRDMETGEDLKLYMFIAIAPYSCLTFACCVPDQSIASWLSCSVQMLNFFGGAPKVIICDNLKSAVTKPGAEPVIQAHYLAFGRFYKVAILPARVRHPRDKGAVEGAVRYAQNVIQSRLADFAPHSPNEVNTAVAALLPLVNDRVLQKGGGDTRRSLFEREERHMLQKLPERPFQFREPRSLQTVPPNYHVCIENHEYSVPHTYIGKKVQPFVSLHTVEISCGGKLIAKHDRSSRPGHHTTTPEHMPEAHRAQKDLTPEGVTIWAKACGEWTLRLVQKFFAQKVPLQGLPSAQTLRNLSKSHTKARIEQACERAWALQMPSMKGVRHALDMLKVAETDQQVKEALADIRSGRSPNVQARRRAVRAENARRTAAGRQRKGGRA